MVAQSIVVDLDPPKRFRPCLIFNDEIGWIDAFNFLGVIESLSQGIFIATAGFAHALDEAITGNSPKGDLHALMGFPDTTNTQNPAIYLSGMYDRFVPFNPEGWAWVRHKLQGE